MAESRDELAARKKLLLARSNLHRLQISHHAQSFRHSLLRPATAFSFAASPPGRSLLFSALMLVAGRGRASKLVRGAMIGLAIAKAVHTASAAWRRPKALPGDDPPG
jgi:hypothetical protein